MWQNFEKALEKRVRKNPKKSATPDRFMITRAINDYIKNQYGEVGLKNIKAEVQNGQEEIIFLRCVGSSWRAEMKLNEKKIIGTLNKLFETTIIKKIFLN